mmetsp:Transcript_106990/g.271613  ORF Transcript_106990/g.271613 Transcript_106990/m.271613 type:complete len:294 (-) Transcript_106990:21-902(-)
MDSKPSQLRPKASQRSYSTRCSKLDVAIINANMSPKITRMLECQTCVKTAMHTLNKREWRATLAKRRIRMSHMSRSMRKEIIAFEAWLCLQRAPVQRPKMRVNPGRMATTSTMLKPLVQKVAALSAAKKRNTNSTVKRTVAVVSTQVKTAVLVCAISGTVSKITASVEIMIKAIIVAWNAAANFELSGCSMNLASLSRKSWQWSPAMLFALSRILTLSIAAIVYMRPPGWPFDVGAPATEREEGAGRSGEDRPLRSKGRDELMSCQTCSLEPAVVMGAMLPPRLLLVPIDTRA